MRKVKLVLNTQDYCKSPAFPIGELTGRAYHWRPECAVFTQYVIGRKFLEVDLDFALHPTQDSVPIPGIRLGTQLAFTPCKECQMIDRVEKLKQEHPEQFVHNKTYSTAYPQQDTPFSRLTTYQQKLVREIAPRDCDVLTLTAYSCVRYYSVATANTQTPTFNSVLDLLDVVERAFNVKLM